MVPWWCLGGAVVDEAHVGCLYLDSWVAIRASGNRTVGPFRDENHLQRQSDSVLTEGPENRVIKVL